MKKRLISMLLVVVVVFSLMATAALADSIEIETENIDSAFADENLSKAQMSRLQTVFEDKAEEVSKIFSEEMQVSSTKQLMDFNSNVYTLVECVPSGYLIYHNASGRFVEGSATSPSPYAGYSGKLYYGGPTEYYYLDNNMFKHTVLDEEYPVSYQVDFAEHSAEANAYFCSEPDNSVLEYIETGKRTNEMARTVSATTATWIPGANAITALQTESEMSYFGKDACGYIGLAIMLLWHKANTNSNYITSSNGKSYTSTKYFNGAYRYVFNGDPDNYWNGRTFSYNLWRWHSGWGTSDYENGYYSSAAGEIRPTVESYLTSKGIKYSDRTWLFPTTSSIINSLDTYQKPYLLFGNLHSNSQEDKINHAVVVYGYLDDALICHYGWENRSCVYVSGIWGTGYMITA